MAQGVCHQIMGQGVRRYQTVAVRVCRHPTVKQGVCRNQIFGKRVFCHQILVQRVCRHQVVGKMVCRYQVAMQRVCRHQIVTKRVVSSSDTEAECVPSSDIGAEGVRYEIMLQGCVSSPDEVTFFFQLTEKNQNRHP